MNQNKKTLKPYHGILMLAVCAGIIFFVSPILGEKLGLYGTLLGELLMLASAVIIAAVFRGDLKQVFPIHKPRMAAVFGTLILWFGTFLGVMIVTLCVSYFFPKQVIGTSQGLGTAFTSVPFLLSFLIVAITPAICEEAVFRGVVVNSFRAFRYKWLIVVVTGCIFGAFHGSIWRFIPTAILGMVLTYILLETDNMCYTALFHCVNNAVPILLLYGLKDIYANPAMQSQMANMTETGIPMMSIAVYVMWGAAVPFCLYIGNYLLHKGQPGYRLEIFPRENKTTLIVLVIASISIFMLGIMLMGCAILVDKDYLQNMMQQMEGVSLFWSVR